MWAAATAKVTAPDLPKIVPVEWPLGSPPPAALWNARKETPELLWVGAEERFWEIEELDLTVVATSGTVTIQLAPAPPQTMHDLLLPLMDWAEEHMSYDALRAWTGAQLRQPGPAPHLKAQLQALTRLLG